MPRSSPALHRALAAIVLAFAFGCASGPHHTHATGARTPQQASHQFYSALQAFFTGDMAPMREVWSHGPDVVQMGPSGNYLVGWEAVDKEWTEWAEMRLGGKVEPIRMHWEIGDELAVLHCIELGSNVFEGKPIEVEIRSSTVFRRMHGVWKVVAHQTDRFEG